MLTKERLATLAKIDKGTVTVRFHHGRDHKRHRFAPATEQINGGYLERAGLIEIDGEFQRIDLTEAGRHALAQPRI